MPLTIPDHTLKELGLTESEALVELACSLYEAQRISKPMAGKLARLSRNDFEAELIARGLPVVRMDIEYVKEELDSLQS